MPPPTSPLSLENVPMALLQCLVLEWLSPDTVWTLVRASGTFRRCVLAFASSSSTSLSATFRANKYLTGACVRWFREHGVPLRLWTWVKSHAGSVTHFTNGNIHRDDDLPAQIWANGSQAWYQNNQLHRDSDLPAVVSSNGTQLWYWRGDLHRDGDQPAVVLTDGTQEWYEHGQRHRDGDLPARIREAGERLQWYQRGKLHRDGDKPAHVCCGQQEWFQNDLMHRDGDRPAHIGARGCRMWYKHGQVHRGGNRPARIHHDGTLSWYKRGKQRYNPPLPIHRACEDASMSMIATARYPRALTPCGRDTDVCWPCSSSSPPLRRSA